MVKLTAEKLTLKQSKIDEAVLPYPIGRPVAAVALRLDNPQGQPNELCKSLSGNKRRVRCGGEARGLRCIEHSYKYCMGCMIRSIPQNCMACNMFYA